jgi:hypothetical protein
MKKKAERKKLLRQAAQDAVVREVPVGAPVAVTAEVVEQEEIVAAVVVA